MGSNTKLRTDADLEEVYHLGRALGRGGEARSGAPPGTAACTRSMHASQTAEVTVHALNSRLQVSPRCGWPPTGQRVRSLPARSSHCRRPAAPPTSTTARGRPSSKRCGLREEMSRLPPATVYLSSHLPLLHHQSVLRCAAKRPCPNPPLVPGGRWPCCSSWSTPASSSCTNGLCMTASSA